MSSLFPEPGGPTSSALWPPAAATSIARLHSNWPRTSERSGGAAGGSPGPESGGARRGGLPAAWPAGSSSAATASRSVETPSTCAPGTWRASRSLPAGTTSRSGPRSRASSAMGNTPRTGANRTFKQRSPSPPSVA